MAGKSESAKGVFFIRWMKGLYNWVMHWADTPHAAPMLGVLSFAESSFFPVPPDVLLIPMGISRPDRAIRFAAITWVTSVLGGMFGYLIGMIFFDTVGIKIIEFYGVMDKYFQFRELFEEYNFLIIMVAGMTPLPYKVFTITAGVAEVNFPIFLLGSVLSRGTRFMAEGVVCYYGDDFFQKYFKVSIREFLDKYINWFMIGMAVLGVAGFLVVKPLMPGSDVDIDRSVTLSSGNDVLARFWSEPSPDDKHKFNYELSVVLDSGTALATVPGGPYPQPSKGDARIVPLKIEGGRDLIAAVFYSDIPPPEYGTDGYAAVFELSQGELRYLGIIEFERYRLDKGGAWSSGKLELSASEKDGGISATITTVFHSAVKGEEETEKVRKLRYKVTGDKLVKTDKSGPDE